MLEISFFRLGGNFNSQGNRFFKFSLCFFTFWFNGFDINIENLKTIVFEFKFISNRIIFIKTENGFSNNESRLLMEFFERFSSNSSSNFWSHKVAHITNEISDVENSCSIFLIISVNIEFPVIRKSEV